MIIGTLRTKSAILTGILSLVIVVVTAACGNTTAAIPGAATPGANGHFQIGQPAAIGTYLVTINRVLYPPTLDGVTPAQGMKFLVLDLTIKTSDTQNDRLSPAAQFIVKDASGKEYPLDADVTPSTDLTTSQLPDTVPALGSIHGEVAYQVPVDANELRLEFNPSFLGSLIGHGRVLTFDLQP